MTKPDPLKYWCSVCYAERHRPCVDKIGRLLPMAAVHEPRQKLAEAMAKLANREAPQ